MSNVRDFYNQNAALWSHDIGLYPVEDAIASTFFSEVPPKTVLDLGCGAGRTTSDLLKKGCLTIGIDLSESLLKIAKQNTNQKIFSQMNASLLAFPSDAFDVVIFSFNGMDCVFPYASRLMVFQEVQRVLKRGGIFYYTSHNVFAQVKRDLSSKSLARALGFLSRQIKNRDILDGYWDYGSKQNEQVLFAKGPYAELSVIKKMGWELLYVCGSNKFKSHQYSYLHDFDRLIEKLDHGLDGKGASLRDIFLNCPHVHYVCAVNNA